eukprot:1159568-Pelagomonas_calceolata.AAC.2
MFIWGKEQVEKPVTGSEAGCRHGRLRIQSRHGRQGCWMQRNKHPGQQQRNRSSQVRSERRSKNKHQTGAICNDNACILSMRG